MIPLAAVNGSAHWVTAEPAFEGALTEKTTFVFAPTFGSLNGTCSGDTLQFAGIFRFSFPSAAARSAVRKVDQNLYALDDDFVRFLTLDVGNEANSAGIVLMARIVKALRGR